MLENYVVRSNGGDKDLTQPADRGASCSRDRRVPCTTSALLDNRPNPNRLNGALVRPLLCPLPLLQLALRVPAAQAPLAGGLSSCQANKEDLCPLPGISWSRITTESCGMLTRMYGHGVSSTSVCLSAKSIGAGMHSSIILVSLVLEAYHLRYLIQLAAALQEGHNDISGQFRPLKSLSQ